MVETLREEGYDVGEAVLIVRGKEPAGDAFQIVHANVPSDKRNTWALRPVSTNCHRRAWARRRPPRRLSLTCSKAKRVGKPCDGCCVAPSSGFVVRSERAQPHEIDHLVSLELGGANGASNLWLGVLCRPRRQGRLFVRMLSIGEEPSRFVDLARSSSREATEDSWGKRSL